MRTNADEDLATAGGEGLRSMLIFIAQSKVPTPDREGAGARPLQRAPRLQL